MELTEHRSVGGGVTQADIDAESAARTAADALLIPLTQKAAADGVATLDGTSHIPDGQIPTGITRDSELSSAIAALVNSAPGTLDTLAELATALGNDPNLATTLTAAIAAKVSDTAYAGSWDGVTAVAPSKNAVFDKIQALSGASVLLAGSTSTGEQVGPDWKATGKTGATTQPLTLAGGTASGAPVSGTHEAGELTVDALGFPWYCTIAGTPGTWVCIASGREIASVAGVGINTTTSTTVVDLPTTPLSIALPLLPVPVWLLLHASPGGTAAGGSSSPSNNTNADGVFISLVDGGGTGLDGYSYTATAANSPGPGCYLRARIPSNTAAQTVKIQFLALTGGTARLTGVATRPLLFTAFAA